MFVLGYFEVANLLVHHLFVNRVYKLGQDYEDRS